MEYDTILKETDTREPQVIKRNTNRIADKIQAAISNKMQINLTKIANVVCAYNKSLTY